jgi:cephalosporin-C deacetylase
MPMFDLPPERLRRHVTALADPPDLDAFWAETLAENSHAVDASFQRAPSILTTIETLDTTFRGYRGDEIRGWLHLPANRTAGELPCVVEYLGYGGGRGYPHQHVLWAAAGFAHFVMDTRGQGSAWSTGHTSDPNTGESAYPGFLTRGILSRNDYYYRRLYVDAARAVDAARSHPSVDPEKVAVAGISQGGGLSLAVAALRDDIAAALPEVPFLSDMRRATELVDTSPYNEVSHYLKVHRERIEEVFQTLAYFDVALLAQRATAPALFSVGMMDTICPPSTVLAAYNAYRGPKQIAEYAYNEHDGGGELHEVLKVGWLRSLFDDPGRSAGAEPAATAVGDLR